MRSDRAITAPVIALFQNTLDRPIAFHPVFADLTRSVTAGLLLSQAVYWTTRVTLGDWFYKTMKQWEEETKLSRHAQAGARKILRQFSFWHEERRGVPAQMYFRVDIAALYDELLSSKDTQHARSRLQKSGKLDCRKAANKNAGKQQSGLPKTGNLYKGISETTTENTSKTTTTTPYPPVTMSPGDPISRRFIEKILSGTLFRGANPGRIAQAAKQYKRSQEEIEAIVHMLDGQYRLSTRRIKNPTALLVSAIRDAIAPPENPSKSEQDTIEAEYQEATRKLDALAEAEREEIFTKARAGLHPSLRDSFQAVKAAAVGILLSQARAPS